MRCRCGANGSCQPTDKERRSWEEGGGGVIPHPIPHPSPHAHPLPYSSIRLHSLFSLFPGASLLFFGKSLSCLLQMSTWLLPLQFCTEDGEAMVICCFNFHCKWWWWPTVLGGFPLWAVLMWMTQAILGSSFILFMRMNRCEWHWSPSRVIHPFWAHLSSNIITRPFWKLVLRWLYILLKTRDKYFEPYQPIWNASNGAETTQPERHPSVPVRGGLFILLGLHNLSTLQLPEAADYWWNSKGEAYRVHSYGLTYCLRK